MFQNLNPLDKPTAIMEIIIMLVVAALIGFFIGWLMQKFGLDKAKAESRFLEDKYDKLNAKHVQFEKENREFLSTITDLRKRKDSLLKELDELKADNKFIEEKYKDSTDTKTFDAKVSELNNTITNLKSKNEALKKQLVEEHHTGNKIEQLQKENASLKTQIEQLNDAINTKKPEDNNQSIAAVQQLKVDLAKIQAEKTQVESELSAANKSNNEIKTALEQLQQEFQQLKEESAQKAKQAQEVFAAANHIERDPKILSAAEIEERKQQLIKNVGTSSEAKKDALSKINGIGPLIEAKLNSIGIYTFEQIGKLSKNDIELVTELIEFFPGRIERDNWIQQANEMSNTSANS